MKIPERLRSVIPIKRWRNPPPLVSVIRLSGVIGSGGLRGGLTLASLAQVIERAFAPDGQKAVALLINSPGGSPVQSSLIAGRIRQMAAEKKVPVLAFCEDVAASGGYWLACAADEIFADESSIIGSVGVIYAGFGFQDLIARHGIERRVHTAGTRKSVLDPFRPEDPEDIDLLRGIQGDIHDAFKAMVRARRGERLKGDEAELFSGAFWAGRGALERGLIDGLGDVRSVMRARFGKEVRLRLVSAQRGWLPWRRGLSDEALGRSFAAGITADTVAAALSTLDERAMWARYGL
ncbi:MAG TPA: S49 family peptidase [Azospirillaceae bacterium]|nr:S49 family peptidase [Azospirillaceae bacterium]